jgi:NAD(P)-dependent dehydrogenase (short-subunit alcohol dehydrogenase family)
MFRKSERSTAMSQPADTASAVDRAEVPVFNGLRVGITGGTSGLGLGLVRELTERGASVAFVARTAGDVERVAREQGAHGIVGDISLKGDIHPIAMQMVGELGGLDVLINNASDLGPAPLALLGDTECEDFERALATNVLGPFRLTRALLGALAASAREGRGAVVVNISSDAAVNPYARWGVYGASKAALHHMTRIWNEEQSEDGIVFLSLDPGDMDTPLHALAVPEADPSTLKQPDEAALEVVEAVGAALARLECSRSVRTSQAGLALPDLDCDSEHDAALR